MNVDDVLRWITHSADPKAIEAVWRAAEKRGRLLSQRSWDERVANKWYELKDSSPGITLYCHAPGTFIGGPMQRGDAATVIMVQPRKKRVWLKIGETSWGFPPTELARYDLRPEPFEGEQVSTLERKLGSLIGNL